MISFSNIASRVHEINCSIIADMIDAKDEEAAKEAMLFSKHLFLTKLWFIPTSCSNKKTYLTILLEDTTSVWALSLVLKAIWNFKTKDSVMSRAEEPHLSYYDQVPLDQNRTETSLETLAQVMMQDRQWFVSLKPEHQSLVLCDLLVFAGEQVVNSIFDKAIEIYNDYHDKQVEKLVRISKTASLMKQPESQEKLQKKRGKNEKFYANPNADRVIKAEPGTKAQQEIETHQNIWNSTLKSLRDSIELEEIEMVFKDGTSNKFWKVNRPKPEFSETVDMIQLLPSQISKRILMLLPSNELINLGKVNKYWAYLINEIKQETHAQEQIESAVLNLREILLKYDESLEMVELQDNAQVALQYSQSVNKLPTFLAKTNHDNSIKASEGGTSFKHFLKNRLATTQVLGKTSKPIRNMRDLNDRLELRGAADDNLWKWCKNVFRIARDKNYKTKDEQPRFAHSIYNLVFPSPLTKKKLKVPLSSPLTKEPTDIIKHIKKAKIVVSTNTDTINPKTAKANKYSLWAKDLSKLYPVVKIPSYNWPT